MFCRSVLNPYRPFLKSLVVRTYSRQPVNNLPPRVNQARVVRVSKSRNDLQAEQRSDSVESTNTLSQLLKRPALIIGRQMEMLNLFLGFEQANRYAIWDPPTMNQIGYILEDGMSLGQAIMRQIFRTHRPFTATIVSTEGDVLLRLKRPFQFINSRLIIMDAHENILGEVHQRWHLFRRRYDLLVGTEQFAEIDQPFLSWNFDMKDETGRILGNVNKNFLGFGREIFTDTSQYVFRMDSSSGLDLQHQIAHGRPMTLDERAVALGCAISIDFDYFSRHSGGGGLLGWLPFGIFGGFGGSDE